MQDRLLIVGKKIGMTQLFDQNNRLMPVTVISAEPCRVSQIKTEESDGYKAVQIAYQEKNHANKAVMGHLEKTDEVDQFTLGQSLNVDLFPEGQLVDVVATTKGKGFQGVVRRHDFRGGRATHGSMSHRRGGGYGHFRRMGHIIKNQKMPGHMGLIRATVQNLVVVKIVPEKRLILVKGSVPGAKGSFVMIRKSKSA